METLDLLVVLLLEIEHHGNSGACITLLELACVWTHVKSDIADLVSLVMTITGHDNGTLEFIDDGLLDFGVLWLLVSETLALLVETLDLLINQLEAVVD